MSVSVMHVGTRQMIAGWVCGPIGLTLNELWLVLKDMVGLLTIEFHIVRVN